MGKVNRPMLGFGVLSATFLMRFLLERADSPFEICAAIGLLFFAVLCIVAAIY